MSKSIQDVHGISPRHAGMLFDQGIYTTSTLLEVGGNITGRKQLAKKISTDETDILMWVSSCDLFRIHGVSRYFIELLNASGITAVQDLCNKNPETLVLTMQQVDETKQSGSETSKKAPSVSLVSDWIEQAKKLDSLVSH